MATDVARKVAAPIVGLALALAGTSCRESYSSSTISTAEIVVLDACEKAVLRVLEYADPNGSEEELIAYMIRGSTTDELLEYCGSSDIGSYASDVADCVAGYYDCTLRGQMLFAAVMRTLKAAELRQ